MRPQVIASIFVLVGFPLIPNNGRVPPGVLSYSCLAVIVAPAALHACDLCAVYNSNAARGESSVGFHVILAEQFTHSATLQEDGAKVANPIGQYRDSSITSLIPEYNFNPWLGLSLSLPYIHRSFRRAAGFEVEEGTESGLGDIALVARFLPVSKVEHEYSYTFGFIAGVEFPTGDSDRLEEEANEVEMPGAPASGVHGNDLALGSGSYDAIVGLAANVRWRRLFFTTDLQYFIRTRGDFDYRFGNELSVAGGPGAYLLFDEDKTFTLQFNVNYESKGRDHLAGIPRDDGIVTAWYAGPGLTFTWGERFSATANVDIPLHILSRAVQTVPDYRVRGGITCHF